MNTKKESRPDKKPSLKKKPYLLCFFVAYSSLVIVSCILNLLGVLYPLDASMLIKLAISVMTSVMLMSFTDRLPIQNRYIIILIDILCIVVSVFGMNLITILLGDSWFSFDATTITIILATIVIPYISTCVVFFISDVKCQRDINARIRMMRGDTLKNEGNEYKGDK